MTTRTTSSKDADKAAVTARDIIFNWILLRQSNVENKKIPNDMMLILKVKGDLKQTNTVNNILVRQIQSTNRINYPDADIKYKH